MQLQDRNLSIQMRGEDVALLQRELAQLLESGLLDAEISADEVGSQFFGPTTREAVRLLQEQEGLEPTGIVDDKTARRINEALGEEGGEEEPVGGDFVVRGIVQSAARKSFTGRFVDAYDVDMRSEEPLGEAPLDERGAYEIRYRREQFHAAGRLEYEVACIRRRSIN